MSWQPATDPKCEVEAIKTPVDLVIVPRARDLGGFEVRRALPSGRRQMVGPFIFFDQMGPSEFILGEGIDVRPTRISGLPPSPICSRARSCTATPSAPT